MYQVNDRIRPKGPKQTSNFPNMDETPNINSNINESKIQFPLQFLLKMINLHSIWYYIDCFSFNLKTITISMKIHIKKSINTVHIILIYYFNLQLIVNYRSI